MLSGSTAKDQHDALSMLIRASWSPFCTSHSFRQWFVAGARIPFRSEETFRVWRKLKTLPCDRTFTKEDDEAPGKLAR